MNRRDIQKLLGGYATGTLTDEEREALFEAALEDQTLFDALAREQPLRDLLAEPAARAHLISVLGEDRPPLAVRIAAWLRRPQVMALAASAAVALVAVALFVPHGSAPVQEKAVQVATTKRPEPSLPPREEPRPVQSAHPRAKEAPPKRAEKPAAPPPRAVADLAATAPAPALPPPPVAETVVADAAPPALPAGAPPPPPLKRDVAYTAQLARMNTVQREEKAEAATRASMPGAGVVAGAVTRRQPALAAGVLRYSALDSLHTGGPIRLRFDSRESGWLYVLVAEREGWRLAASDQIEAGRLRVVSVRFEEPGRKELLAIVSRTEQSDLRQDKMSVPPAAAASLRIILEITRP